MFSKKINLSLLFLALAAGAQAQKTKVQGDIKGITGPVIFNYSAGIVKKADTVNVKNGKFSWEAKLSEPQKVTIGFPKETVPFYADQGEIRIAGKADALQQLSISGSSLQREADAYFASIKDLNDREAAIAQQYKTASKDEQKVLNEKRERLRLQKKERLTQYITAHPKSYFSASLIADQALKAYVKPLYDLLDPAMQQTAAGKMISQSLAELTPGTYNAFIKELKDQEAAINQQYKNASKDEQKVLEEEGKRLQLQKEEKLVQYIKANPKSDFSLSLILDKANWGAIAGYPDIKPLVDLLDPAMLQTAAGKKLSERLAVLKRSAPGEPMLNFTLNSVSGRPVQFSDFKGHYVLVDFWASWCGPCRAENPNVLAAYNHYKDKNFTVIGVSFDHEVDKWKKAIQEDKLPWTQVSELKGFRNEISTYYGIKGIPSTLLVGPDGKIIAKDLRGEALHKKLGELLDK